MPSGRRTGARWRVIVTAVASVTCTIVTSVPAQTVTPRSNLAFAAVISGTSTSIDPRASSAMSFDINTAVPVSLGWSLTLPTVLTRTGGGATMPITFCSTCGVYRVANPDPAGGITFNPASGVAAISLLSPLHVYVWVGGAVWPPLQQLPGSYTGTIVLTLAAII